VEFRVRDVTDRHGRLLLEMSPEIRLAHRSDWVPAHRMAVNAMNRSIRCGSKQTALEDETSKMWRPDDNWDETGMEDVYAKFNSASDAAMLG